MARAFAEGVTYFVQYWDLRDVDFKNPVRVRVRVRARVCVSRVRVRSGIARDRVRVRVGVRVCVRVGVISY